MQNILKPVLTKQAPRYFFWIIITFVIALDIIAVHAEAKAFKSMIIYAKENSTVDGSERISTASAISKVVTEPTSVPQEEDKQEEKNKKSTIVSMFSRNKDDSEDSENESGDNDSSSISDLFNLEATAEAAEIDDGCKISDTFTPEVKVWEDDICKWSEEHNMDPDLIATVMQIESCGNDVAKSATGVRGLFQVTGANLDGEDPWDPNVSMAKGPGKVLKAELDAAGGDVRAAMAGYNGGGKARDYISGEISRNQFYWFLVNHPSGYWWTRGKALAKINEVERYAQWANIYFEAKQNSTDTMQEWLDLGGNRLCSAARRGLAQYTPEE